MRHDSLGRQCSGISSPFARGVCDGLRYFHIPRFKEYNKSRKQPLGCITECSEEMLPERGRSNWL
jgi:hypothetical protein